jgi:hypothetical protein
MQFHDGLEVVTPLPAWLASRKNALPGTLTDFKEAGKI